MRQLQIKLNAKQLRAIDPSLAQQKAAPFPRQQLYFILDNIFDTYNIGGLFRLADALAVRTIYLCGETTTPPNNRIHKASCGTYKVVAWEYAKTPLHAISKLKKENPTLTAIAVEQSEKSTPYTSLSPTLPFAIVVGNETKGCSNETLNACDYVAQIPMWGINKSLNVIVSAAVVAYHFINTTRNGGDRQGIPIEESQLTCGNP